MQLIICDDDKLFIQKLQHCLQLFFKQHHLTLPKIITFYKRGRIAVLYWEH